MQEIARVAVRPGTLEGLSVLLEELSEDAPKAARGAIAALPELQRRAGLSDVLAWIDLGVALAGSSGAVALRYFKESPVLLGLVDHAARASVLEAALELADHDANVAWEFFRVAPELVTVLPPQAWSAWMDVAGELAATDFTLAVEYVRQIAAIAPVLPVEEVRS